MASPGFWNDNSYRDYPFLLERTGWDDMSHGAIGQLPFASIVDFGSLFGVASGFDPAQHTVWLSEVRRLDSDTIRFTFSTDCPSVSTVAFEHDLSTEFQYSRQAVATDSTPMSPDACDDEPAWEAFLVTGDLTELAALIPNTNDQLTGTSSQAVLEPATLRSFAGHFIRGIGVANQDRTRATNPEECRELCWPIEIGTILIRSRCLQGPIVFKEGYNLSIQDDEARNRLIFTAAVGQGEGEPCEQVPLSDEEVPPQGRSTLDGAVSCGEVIRSIGGAIGPVIDVLAGGGAAVSFDPSGHRVIINMDLRDMVLAGEFDPNPECDGPMTSENSDNCDCGPV